MHVLLIRNSDKFEFRIYCKPTCENDHIHFFSHYNTNTKRGFTICFYLRVLRICSLKYLNDKFNYIENFFLKLLYPIPFIHFAKSKYLKIQKWNRPWTNVNTPSDKINLPYTQITLPHDSSTNIIENNLNKVCIKTVSLSSKMIHDLLHSNSRRDIFSDAGVYCIPCKDCKLKYIGETARNIYKRL